MIERHVFRQEADAATGGCVSEFMSQHFTMAAAGKHEPDSQMHCRGFACAVGAEKAEDLTALHTQGEAAQGRYPLAPEKAVVMLADIIKGKGRKA